jgi:hypothetical protein
MSVIIKATQGTAWENISKDALDMSNTDWTAAQYTIAETDNVISGFTLYSLVGSAGAGTKNFGFAGTLNEYTMEYALISAYVKKGDVDHCYIRLTATNASAAAQGGTQWFNLSTGALGTFTAVNTGTLSSAGITSVGDGFYIWAAIDTQGNDTFGSAWNIGASDADNNLSLTGDGSTINLYLGGTTFVDGPTDDTGFIAQ